MWNSPIKQIKRKKEDAPAEGSKAPTSLPPNYTQAILVKPQLESHCWSRSYVRMSPQRSSSPDVMHLYKHEQHL